MKVFNRFLLLSSLIAIFNNTYGQTRFGLNAGVNFSNVRVKDMNNKVETQSNVGIRLGLTVEIPIAQELSFQPGLAYVEKGFKKQTDGFGDAKNFKVNLSYVELPVNLTYKLKVFTGRLLLGAGPYVAYGFSGTWKSDNDILIGDIRLNNHGKTIFKNNVADGEFGNYLFGKPFDYGANFLAGYEFFEQLSVQFNAQFGVANLQPKFGTVTRDGSLRNTAFGFTVGYSFK